MNRAGFHLHVPKPGHFVPILIAGFVILVFAAVAVSALPFAEWFETAYRDSPAASGQTAE